MNHKDMEIFEYIMKKNNSQFVGIDDMAGQLAVIINNKLNDIKSVSVPVLGTINLYLNYRLSTDSFSYTTTLPYSTGTQYDVANEWDDDGVGYIILSANAIA